MTAERYEVLEPTLRGVAASYTDACRRVVALGASATVPYWVVRDAATGASYVVTVAQARETVALSDPGSRRADPLPLVEETSDPSELPTVAEWLAAGGTLREVPPGEPA